MSRLLVAAAAILAGIVVPAAATLALPRPAAATSGVGLPTVTVPTVPVPTVPVPTVPTPTVPTPTVPTPTVPTPTVPTPTVPVRPPASPTGTSPLSPTSTSAGPVATSALPPETAGEAGLGSSTGQVGRASADGTRSPGQQPRLRVSRFHLATAGLVRVEAWELAPRCGFVGSYVVRGGRGTNLLRLPRRIGRHRLRVGTYHLVGASRGATVVDISFRLVRRKQRLRVRLHHLADVCTAATALAATVPAGNWPFGAGGSTQPVSVLRPTAAPTTHRRNPFLPPVLGDLNPASASPLLRAVLFALLGFAIAFLAAASLPDRAVATAGVPFVSRHRATLTLGGFVLLVAAALLLGFL